MPYTLGLYFRLIGARVRSEMQYRLSFFAQMFGSFLVTILDFVTVVVLLNRFQQIAAWGLADVAFLYSTSAVSYALADMLAGGFNDFERLIIRGDFDRLLLRPLSTPMQLMTEGFPLRVLGRLAQGLLALGFALWLLHPSWDPGRWLFLGVTLAGGCIFFLALLIAGATFSFWSPQTAEATNIVTYGGQFMTSYPMSIYEDWMRSFFTFVLPMAFINYYPALYLLGKPDPFGLPGWAAFLSPAIALLALVAALAFWRVGIRHYQSTGS